MSTDANRSKWSTGPVNFRARRWWGLSIHALHSPSKLRGACGRGSNESCERRLLKGDGTKGKNRRSGCGTKKKEKRWNRVPRSFSPQSNAPETPCAAIVRFQEQIAAMRACKTRLFCGRRPVKQIFFFQNDWRRWMERWMENNEERRVQRENASRMNEISSGWALKPSSKAAYFWEIDEPWMVLLQIAGNFAIRLAFLPDSLLLSHVSCVATSIVVHRVGIIPNIVVSIVDSLSFFAELSDFYAFKGYLEIQRYAPRNTQ